ncbi:MAG: Adenine-specific DNA methylase [Clostridia bacterium 41_269]|nr:MAG: Adenine-specific DNA methylase [Clostridia bacterium 41_269]
MFAYPKAVDLISDCIRVCNFDESAIILDFFAGSGTTAHAVIDLNRHDGGQRKYILVEMADYFDTVLLPRIKKVIFSDQWKDGRAQENGKGISHFIKYFRLEQYEDVLRRACYKDAEPIFVQTDPYNQYVFLRDTKMLDNTQTGEKVMTVDLEKNEIRVDLSKLYDNIDLAETLSCVTGKWIRRIYTRPDDPSQPDEVEFEDGRRVSLTTPPWELVKPLIWW